MSAAASLSDVCLRWGSRWPLAHLSFSIPAGDITLLTGANGAGKTTLLRLLSTALKPTRGTLHLMGQPAFPHPERVRPRVALMTHHSHLYDDLSAAENLQVVAQLTGTPPGNIPHLLDQVGLAADMHRPVRDYSAGMKRRLCLARVLLRQPELALLDEPFGQLDPAGVQLMEQVIRDLHRRGTTVVLSTHDLPRGLRLGQHHIHLQSGQAPRGVQPVEQA